MKVSIFISWKWYEYICDEKHCQITVFNGFRKDMLGKSNGSSNVFDSMSFSKTTEAQVTYYSIGHVWIPELIAS